MPGLSRKPDGALAYCRAGFEPECGRELKAAAEALGVAGTAHPGPGGGYALFTPKAADGGSVLMARLRFAPLTFARQLVFTFGRITDLPGRDRVTPLLEAVRPLAPHFSQFFLETPDTNEAKQRSGFCRRFAEPLGAALLQAGLLDAADPGAPRLHLYFTDADTAHLGLSYADNASPWAMGIPRLRLPREAPSRAALKLGEALLIFFDEAEREARLRPGLRAVDLGASPGGWTWQLERRGLRVTAVDNGPLAQSLVDSACVEHVRADGFRYRPKRPVDWMVCDMVERPARIAALVAEWFVAGWCRDCVFTLKLPMKKRYEEVELCRDLILTRLAKAGVRARLRIRQLYHDREEVTGCLRTYGDR